MFKIFERKVMDWDQYREMIDMLSIMNWQNDCRSQGLPTKAKK
jgi:hypothetical protein